MVASQDHLEVSPSGHVTFVDSTGLGVFVAASRRAARIGCSFVLRSPRPNVLRTLRLTGIDGRINIETGDAVL